MLMLMMVMLEEMTAPCIIVVERILTLLLLLTLLFCNIAENKHPGSRSVRDVCRLLLTKRLLLLLL